jgi:hypothetical protein
LSDALIEMPVRLPAASCDSEILSIVLSLLLYTQAT